MLNRRRLIRLAAPALILPSVARAQFKSPCSIGEAGLCSPAGAVAAGDTTTWDPSNIGAGLTLSNGNLTVAYSSEGSIARSTTSHTTGKYYVEITATGVSGSAFGAVGILNGSQTLSNDYLGDAPGNSAGLQAGGIKYFNNANWPQPYNGGFAQGNVVQVAVDVGNQLLWIAINGGTYNPNGTGSPGNPGSGTGGTNFATTSPALSTPWFIGVSPNNAGDSFTANFGATAFSYTAPSGFGKW